MAPSRKVKRSTRRGKATRRRQRGGDNAMVASVSANAKPANAKPANAKPANSKPANAAGKTYTLTLTLPLSTTSTCADFPSDLGKFSGAVQGFSFTNPTKTITDIQFVDNAGKVVKDAAKYGTSSSSSAIKIMIGSAQNLVPSYVAAVATGTCAAGVSCVRGATPLGASNGKMGAVTVNNLTQNTLNAVGKNATGKPVSQTFTVKVTTSN